MGDQTMKKLNTRMYATDNSIGIAYIIFILLFIYTVMWANIDNSKDFRTIERTYNANGLYLGDAGNTARHGSICRSDNSDSVCDSIDSTLVDQADELDGEEVSQYEVTEDTEEQIEEEIVEGELELLALLIQAEAGNQDYKGKCLVADVVLNRMNNDTFPDTISDVVYQYLTGKNGDKYYQFSTVVDGGLENAGWYISEDCFKAAYQEYYAERRTDDSVLYFTAGSYNPYCVPAYRYGDHYFGY